MECCRPPLPGRYNLKGGVDMKRKMNSQDMICMKLLAFYYGKKHAVIEGRQGDRDITIRVPLKKLREVKT